MTTNAKNNRLKAAALYERYGKPMEETHRGDFVAIAENGETITGTTFMVVEEEAKERLGYGTKFIFKIGERVETTYDFIYF